MSKRNKSRKRSQRIKKNKKIYGILYSSRDRGTAINRFFHELSPREIYNGFGAIASNSFFKNTVSIDSKKDLSTAYTGQCPYTDLDKSVYWCLGLIEHHSELLHFFINTEKLITESLLNSEYDRCIELLNNLDDQLGVSVWSISIRGSIYSLTGAHQDSVNLENTIGKLSKTNEFINAITSNVASRYQDPDIYMSNIRSFVSQIFRSFDGELLNFLVYKLCPEDMLFNYNYTDIFNYEKNAPLVDTFHCLIKQLTSLCINSDARDGDIAFITKRMSKLFDYPPINSLANFCGIQTTWRHNDFDYHLLDLYTKGEYEKIVKMYIESPINFTEFQHYELLSKSAARTGDLIIEGQKGDITKSLISVILKDDNYDMSLSSLMCLTHCFSSLMWFKELGCFVDRERSIKETTKQNRLRNYSIISSGVNTPRKVDILPSELVPKYIESFSAVAKKSITSTLYRHKNNLHEIDLEQLKEVDDDRLNKYIAKSLVSNEKYIEAIEILKPLSGSNDVLLQQEVSRTLIDSYIHVGNKGKAIEEFVNKCIHNERFIQNYNTELICESSISIINESNSLHIPIALSLHSRFVDAKYESALKYSFENFLKKNNVKKPLDDISIFDTYDIGLKEFFLEHVCTPNNMKLYLEFDSTREIEECRIDICNYLLNNNIGGKESLIREVKERTKKLVISKAVKQVESSKIYSDTSVFFSGNARSRIEQLYEKFSELNGKDFSQHRDEQVLSNIVRVYERLKEQGILDKNRSLLLIPPINEKNAAFFNLMQRVRDEFAFGEKGLNNFLSTRIRHGHLPTTLRKCLVSESLTTSRLSDKEHFIPNEFWLSRLCSPDSNEYKQLDKLFSDFSTNFEQEISSINDNWLQIFTLDKSLSDLADKRAKSESIFDFSIDIYESFSVYTQMSQELNYDDYVNQMVDWLWVKTDKCLEKARAKLSNDARNKFSELLDSLRVDVYQIIESENTLSEFNNSVARAKTSMSSNLDHVASWFNRSDENMVPNYEIDTAIEIASRAVDIDVEFTKDKQYRLKGSTLSHFVDLFYIFIENAVSKSNISRDSLKISVNIKDLDGEVILIVENNCEVNTSNDEANEGLKYYIDSYGKVEKINRDIQSEGGTGFFKVWNILQRTLSLTNLMSMEFVDENMFRVELRLFNFEEVIDNENTTD